MEILLYLGLAMAAGLVFNRLAKLVKLPNVTGYLVAGLLFGPYVLKLLPAERVAEMSIVTNVALAFIAFSIGGSFNLKTLKQIGGKVLIITALEACMGSAAVIAALLAFRFPVPEALLLGAIAAATAPAATLLVVKQYKASGPLTSMLLPVVAMDDAVCLILFSVLSSVAAVLANGTSLNVGQMLLKPLKEIGLSLALGAAIGVVVALCARAFKSRANRICVIVCSLFLCTALADRFGLSQLLVCMMNAAVMVNLTKEADKLLEGCDRWTPPLFMLFFVISGAQLNLTVLRSVGLLAVAYIVFRAVGKYAGATLGAVVTKAHPSVKKYLGLTLLPQAGVAIAMSQLAVDVLPAYGDQIRAVVLTGTLVYELLGPVIAKIALTKAGETHLESGSRKKARANA